MEYYLQKNRDASNQFNNFEIALDIAKCESIKVMIIEPKIVRILIWKINFNLKFYFTPLVFEHTKSKLSRKARNKLYSSMENRFLSFYYPKVSRMTP